MTDDLSYCHIDSPVGRLLLAGTADALHFLSFPAGHKAFGPRPGWVPDDAPFAVARRQLEAYFAGRLRRFDLPLHLGGTPFQRLHWHYLATIPHGETRSYAQVAAALGRPNAARAVGAANGANPLPILLPCHRVLGADGTLTGFGGGVATKAWLLRHESAMGAGSGAPTPQQAD